MSIEKNGKIYIVTATAKNWVVSRVVDKVTIKFEIPKETCSDEASLRAYVAEKDIF